MLFTQKAYITSLLVGRGHHFGYLSCIRNLKHKRSYCFTVNNPHITMLGFTDSLEQSNLSMRRLQHVDGGLMSPCGVTKLIYTLV